MFATLALTATLAFNGPAPRAVPRGRAVSVRMEEAVAEVEAPPPPPPAPVMSASVPFLVKNKNLDGLVGDSGFDPLGLSNVLPIDWMVEAELKHGRVCMLAVVGMIAPGIAHLPGRDFDVVAAHNANLANGAMSQILLWTGLLEVTSLIAIVQMLEGSGRKPGDYGFDPMGFSKKGNTERMALAEVKNGRLAMLAFSGMITQAALCDSPTFPFLG